MKTNIFTLTLLTLATLIILPYSFAQKASSPERMVRMIYFLPNDQEYRPKVVQNMQDMIPKLQTFFSEQMQAHGYGKRTFRFETDDKGEPKVHRVDGLHSNKHYFKIGGCWGEVQKKFSLGNNVGFLVWDNGESTIGGAGGIGGGDKRSGQLTLPASYRFGIAAHELAHAFGLLSHDFRHGKYILSYGPGQNQLSTYAAVFLAVHPYFNPDVPIEYGKAPTIELMSPRTYPAGSEGVTIRLKVSDPDGVHQVFLSNSGDLFVWRGLKGKKDAIVEFEYKGVNTKRGYISISDAVSHSIRASAVDKNGDTSFIEFVLSEISEYHKHAFGDHKNGVRSLAFSPDGKKIASAGWDDVMIWDVATQQNIATFEGGRSVAFSPNGRILATGGGNVNLWDVTTQRNIATLKHTSNVWSLAFSPDGTILASGTVNGMIKLWDVAMQREMFTFEAHKVMDKHVGNPIHSLVFSPDGTILASATYDRTIKLWDVVTWENFASISRI